MPNQTVLTIEDPTCLKAVEAYAAELQRAGLPVLVREVSADFELVGQRQDASAAGERTLCIEWSDAQAPGQCPREDWEDDEDEDSGQPGGQAASRTASHYVQTFDVLGRDVATAAALLDRVEGGGRARRPARGRT